MHTKNTYKGVDPELKLTVHTCSKFWFHIGNMGNNEWSRHSILYLYVVNRHSISCLQGLVQGGGLGGMPPDPPSRHARLHMCGCAFARYYHPAIILFPPLPPPPTQDPV